MSKQLQICLRNLTPAFKLMNQKKGLSAGGSSDVLPPGAGRLPRKSQREWESHAAHSWFP